MFKDVEKRDSFFILFFFSKGPILSIICYNNKKYKREKIFLLIWKNRNVNSFSGQTSYLYLVGLEDKKKKKILNIKINIYLI